MKTIKEWLPSLLFIVLPLWLIAFGAILMGYEQYVANGVIIHNVFKPEVFNHPVNL